MVNGSGDDHSDQDRSSEHGFAEVFRNMDLQRIGVGQFKTYSMKKEEELIHGVVTTHQQQTTLSHNNTIFGQTHSQNNDEMNCDFCCVLLC